MSYKVYPGGGGGIQMGHRIDRRQLNFDYRQIQSIISQIGGIGLFPESKSADDISRKQGAALRIKSKQRSSDNVTMALRLSCILSLREIGSVPRGKINARPTWMIIDGLPMEAPRYCTKSSWGPGALGKSTRYPDFCSTWLRDHLDV